MNRKQEMLRAIPKIDEVLEDRRLLVFFKEAPRRLQVESVREAIASLRKKILDGVYDEDESYIPDLDLLIEGIKARLSEKMGASLRRTVNATGVVLHTNLGRARLSEEACQRVWETACNYSTLEYNLKKGERGSRHDHVEKIIKKITGAESAMVVNNNAAATMICLAAIAFNREVIVSRGELVEIGGSFRIPEIMAQSGIILKEIGTTNKTKLEDYKNAIGDNTAALLKVHTSNYRIVGFTQDAKLQELVALGLEKNIPVIYDMGSGLMTNLMDCGIDEPTVADSLATGIDVILFSGDKLLGGPQGGIIAGKKEYIEKMKSHPLARVLRVDKMTLAAMEATFTQYLDMEKAKETIPVLKMLTVSYEKLLQQAKDMAEALKNRETSWEFQIEDSFAKVGGGSAPTIELKGASIAVKGPMAVEKLERILRKQSIPIISRLSKGKLYLDMRTLNQEEREVIVETLVNIDSTEFKG